MALASSDRNGFRGYISSRPVRTTQFPQRIQNLVIRTYAHQHGLPYRLSLAEYAMPHCRVVLETILNDELAKLSGIILFSMFLLPDRAADRDRLYRRVLGCGAELHAALENVAINTMSEIGRFEDTIRVAQALRRAPLNGTYGKYSGSDRQSDPFVAQLNAAIAAEDRQPVNSALS